MGVEIEAKMSLTSHEPVRHALQAAGATFIIKELETNHILDTPEQTLTKSGRGLRVRRARNLEDGSEVVTLTVKGPLQAGPLKTRPEFELTATDADTALGLFQALGYVPMLTFEKRRETWELGDCEIVLDEIPHLGLFVEIEGPGDSAVMEARRKLGVADRPLIRQSYVALLMEYHLQDGLQSREILFDRA
jgi:adenylate cyclase class 2